MKGPSSESSTYICLLLSFPSFLTPLSPRSAPTSRFRLSPFSSSSKMAADRSGWLVGCLSCLTGLILDYEVVYLENDPRGRRDRRRRFGRTRPRARSHLSLSLFFSLFLSLSLALLFDSKITRAPAYRSLSLQAARTEAICAAVTVTRPISSE